MKYRFKASPCNRTALEATKVVRERPNSNELTIVFNRCPTEDELRTVYNALRRGIRCVVAMSNEEKETAISVDVKTCERELKPVTERLRIEGTLITNTASLLEFNVDHELAEDCTSRVYIWDVAAPMDIRPIWKDGRFYEWSLYRLDGTEPQPISRIRTPLGAIDSIVGAIKKDPSLVPESVRNLFKVPISS